MLISEFRHLLLLWFDASKRDLPWRRTRDPYAIWVSEIMLQQTRVAAVLSYFHRFLERFPTLGALAGASETEVLAAWAGLGYYSRVRNMHRAARALRDRFPDTHGAIRALPGIGDYTAAAIASIAFGLPHAAVDGNVLRVLSRISDEPGNIATAPVRKRLGDLAAQLLDRNRPGDFNQAMMELGATLCLPKNPQCLLCPVAALCKARAEGTENQRPVTRRRPQTIALGRTAIIVARDDRVLLWQRPAGSAKLAGFWELPEPEHFPELPSTEFIGRFRHSITNHVFTFDVVLANTAVSEPCKEVVNCAWITRKSLRNVALSTTARKALNLYDRYLNDSGVETLNESIDENGEVNSGPRSRSRSYLGNQ